MKHKIFASAQALSAVLPTDKRVVFSNGCFDILHVGHVTYLAAAKSLGDVLVIAVNTDESVKRLKGESRPVNGIEDRMLLLAALEAVDYVVPFSQDTPLEVIMELTPNVLVKGGDYTIETIVGSEYVLSKGGEVLTIPIVEGKSTTGIIDKLNKK
jgi:D-beta-D-heptose 7-phosphate kinase/D-beta-D-heptose 1-phosphate adenosyltransferase